MDKEQLKRDLKQRERVKEEYLSVQHDTPASPKTVRYVVTICIIGVLVLIIIGLLNR